MGLYDIRGWGAWLKCGGLSHDPNGPKYSNMRYAGLEHGACCMDVGSRCFLFGRLYLDPVAQAPSTLGSYELPSIIRSMMGLSEGLA